MARIGILGGTFDPVHMGHLQMAEDAYRQAGLDLVLFMPSRKPPHKRDRNITSEEHRAAMVRLAIEDIPQFIYSDYELQREGMTYTADTLRNLQEEHPENTYSFILGGDSLFQLEDWYHPEEIMRRAEILAVSRYGMAQEQIAQKIDALREQYGARIQIVEMSRLDISSSEIRDRVRKGKALEDMVPYGVERYIRDHSLYLEP